jgi:sulfate permease, SulP family
VSELGPRWLRQYDRSDARGDLRAGITVGVMLVPQGMAYAVIAGVPPIYGLYAGLIPLLVYPFLATSRHLAAGPVAIDMLIVAAGVGLLAQADPDRYLALILLLTAMVGILQLTMGLARLGFLVSFLARPVIAGFAAAAAIIIAFSQLGNLLGIELERSEYILVVSYQALGTIRELDPVTFAVGLLSIALLITIRRIPARIPGALVVVILGTVAATTLGLEARGMEVVGEVPSGLPTPVLPAVNLADIRDLIPTALTLALIQFMSVISLSRLYATRHQYAIDPNRELLGVGAANLVGSFFRALPISGSFSRTSVNDEFGARTPLANTVAAGVVGLTLILLTPLFHNLPMAVLAAIIIVAAIGLIDLKELRYFFRTKPRDGRLALFTFTVTLLVGIREGILLGIAASTLAVLYRLSRPHVAELGHLPGTRLFRDLDRTRDAHIMESILLLRVDAALYFFNAEYFKRFILSKSSQADRRIRAVILDGMSINDLDTTAIEALELIVDDLEAQEIELHFTGLVGPVRDVIRYSGLYRRLGRRHFHASPHQAVERILESWDKRDDEDRLDQYLEEVGGGEEGVKPGLKE